MRGHLATDHSANEPHEAFGLTEIAFAYGLNDDKESVVYLIIQLLRPKLAAQIEPYASSEELIQIFHPGVFAAMDSRDKIFPIYVNGQQVGRLRPILHQRGRVWTPYELGYSEPSYQ